MNFSSNEINIDAIKSKFKDYFNSRGIKYSNGSNFDYLISMFGLNTVMINQDKTISDNNRYFDTAVDENSIYNLAYNVSYNIRRSLSSKVRFVLQYNGTHTEDYFDIDHIEFESKSGYKFYNNSTIRMKLVGGVYKANVVVYNRNVNTENFYGNGTERQSYKLSADNITNDIIIVKSIIGNTDYTWNISKEYENTPNESSLIYNIKKESDGYSIIFGDGHIGQIPQPDEYFTIQYNTNDGVGADGESSFTLKNIRTSITALNNISNYSHTNKKSYGYKADEDIDSIRSNAPKYFSRFGNNVVLADFYNLLNIENANVNASALSKLNIYDSPGGSYYLYLVPISILDSSVTSETDSLPKNKILELSVTSELKEYYQSKIENDLTSDVTSPTYIYVDIYPKIKINDYDNFEFLAKETFNSLSTYFNLNNGFNKSFSNKDIQEYISNSLIDIQFENTFSIVFDNDSLIDHKFFRIDDGQIDNITCDISNTEYNRKFEIDDSIESNTNVKLSTLKIIDSVLQPTESSTYDLIFGNTLLRVGIKSVVAPLGSSEYNITLTYNSVVYDFIKVTIIGDVVTINLVDDTKNIQKILDDIGISYDINNIFKYDINYTKSIINGNQYQKISVINIDFLYYDSTLTKSKRIRYISNKKIGSITTSDINIITPETGFDYTINDNLVTFINLSNDNEMLSVNIVDGEVITNNISILDASYKKNKILISGSNNEYEIYCYEYNSDAIVGELNTSGNTLIFNDNITIFRDYDSNVGEDIPLSDFINNILEDDTKYFMYVDGISRIKSGDNSYLLNNVNFPTRLT